MGAHLDAGQAEAEIERDVAGNGVDAPGIAADQLWRENFVNISLDGGGREKRLAEADEPLAGVNLQPDQIAEFGEPDRLGAVIFMRFLP